MNKLTGLILMTVISFCISGPGMAQEVTVVVKGLAWDSDSWGLRILSKPQQTAGNTESGTQRG